MSSSDDIEIDEDGRKWLLIYGYDEDGVWVPMDQVQIGHVDDK